MCIFERLAVPSASLGSTTTPLILHGPRPVTSTFSFLHPGLSSLLTLWQSMSTTSSTESQAIPLRDLTPVNNDEAAAAAAAAAGDVSPSASAATSSPAPPLRSRFWRLCAPDSYIHLSRQAITTTTELIATLLTLTFAGLLLVPTLRSAEDGRRSREAADWANDSQFRQYCEEVGDPFYSICRLGACF